MDEDGTHGNWLMNIVESGSGTNFSLSSVGRRTLTYPPEIFHRLGLGVDAPTVSRPANMRAAGPSDGKA
jgi:hypothetical protein